MVEDRITSCSAFRPNSGRDKNSSQDEKLTRAQQPYRGMLTFAGYSPTFRGMLVAFIPNYQSAIVSEGDSRIVAHYPEEQRDQHAIVSHSSVVQVLRYSRIHTS